MTIIPAYQPDLERAYQPGLESPAIGGFAVSPSDTADLPLGVRLLRVAQGGDLAVMWADETTLVIPGVLAGESLPVRVRRVLATGTTAGGIVALR